MKHFNGLYAAALLGAAPLALAGSPVANALRDATSLTACMKALDTECTLKWMYTRPLQEQGFDLKTLRAQLNASFEGIRFAQGKTELLELGAPGSPFPGDGRQYIFIPYMERMNVQGQVFSQTAYFIGVSEDEGVSWKFVDGIGFSQKNIRQVIPSYGGGELPPRKTDAPTDLP